MTLTFGSLFSGIGGMDLGLERAGMQCRWQVEWNEYCLKVLAKHWPGVKRYGDIKDIREGDLATVDLICGGFPCQPFSTAGKRKGTKDDRWLWPEFLRIIRQIKPRWVVVENVRGLLSIDSGKVFGGILRDMAESGYDAEWTCIQAKDVGAPHKRERVFIVAHAQHSGLNGPTVSEERRQGIPMLARGGEELGHTIGGGLYWEPRRGPGQVIENGHPQHQERDMANAGGINERPLQKRNNRQRPETETGMLGTILAVPDDSEATRQREHGGEILRVTESERPRQAGGTEGPTQSPMGGTVNGLPSGLDGYGWPSGPDEPQRAWEPPRMAERIPNRVPRLKALGNAIVPQVTEYIGRLIMQAEGGL